jgi:alkanesulfonate monooxygenase SsuD/methylene tetrahydromethanopterin reductase-like flavin-dependent oxidoreductase (luciferase family)
MTAWPRVGAVVFPAGDVADVAAQWREGEAMGLDHGWVYDHHRWGGSGPRPGFWPAAVPVLAVGCAATSRMLLGTLVSPPTRRTPAEAAQTAATLNRLSGGRFVLGLGAGVPGADEELAGQPPVGAGERQERFTEYVAVVAAHLAGDEVDTEGRFVTSRGTLPATAAEPGTRLAVAGNGATAADLAARYGDVWVTNGPRAFRRDGADLDLDQVRRVVARVEQACRRRGRPPRELRVLFLLAPRGSRRLADSSYVTDLAHQLSLCGVTDVVYPYPSDAAPYLGSVTALAALVETAARSQP